MNGANLFRANRIVTCIFFAYIFPAQSAIALSPKKATTQYSRADWTEKQGLPQDAIRTMAQTKDGYLWVGTDEGLARFDGYDFFTFTKDNSSLPSTAITKLASGADGSLWIGTPGGLARYRDRKFTIFTTKDGLPSNVITWISEDSKGKLWVISGTSLCYLSHGKVIIYPPNLLKPIRAARIIYEDLQHTIWLAGDGGVSRLVNGVFVSVLGQKQTGHNGNRISWMIEDHRNQYWIGGTQGIIRMRPDRAFRWFDSHDGLQYDNVRSILEDRDGNLWVGTDGGLSRFNGDRFVPMMLNGSVDMDWVRCMLEDREGDLWLGMNNGLIRLHDELFTDYGRPEGFPSDAPTAVYQDQSGEIWIGYHSEGLVGFRDQNLRRYTNRNGLANNNVIALRGSSDDGILISTTGGLNWMRDGQISTYIPPDPLGRRVVFDALEDRRGQIWVAAPGGVYQMLGGEFRSIVRGGPLLNDSMIVLAEGENGTIWAGSYGGGLWSIHNNEIHHFTTIDGLGSDQIRSLYQDASGTLWIGTLGGGLNSFRDGVFMKYLATDGLLSDNIFHINDDRKGFLWLSTPRGICRVSKEQLRRCCSTAPHTLTPLNYGVESGLRSAQMAPGYPGGSGGFRISDGRMWFPTTRGLSVIDPGAPQPRDASIPVPQILEMSANGREFDFTEAPRLKPGTTIVQFRFVGVHLSDPERVRYEYKLDGLDPDWVAAGTRRFVGYNSLSPGRYTFRIRAFLPPFDFRENAISFEILPQFYETKWFIVFCVLFVLSGVYLVYQFRLRQIHGRFTLVLNERARLARELHDTLAQAFVGIASQLDAMSLKFDDCDSMQQHLVLAQKMARHSLIEARHSIMNLRNAAVFEDQFLSLALRSAAQQWISGRSVELHLDVPEYARKLSGDIKENVVRIAQEAVSNALNHGFPKAIWLQLQIHSHDLFLSVRDNGRGFHISSSLSASDGHFGIVGMRERARRVGGDLSVSSHIGEGTEVKLRIPL